MQKLHPQYIVDENLNRQSVIIPYSEWESVLETMEELEDIQAYDNSKSINDEEIPFEQAILEIENITKQ